MSDTYDVYDEVNPIEIPTQLASDPVLKRMTDLGNEAKDAILLHIDGAVKVLADLEAKAESERAKWLPQFHLKKGTVLPF